MPWTRPGFVFFTEKTMNDCRLKRTRHVVVGWLLGHFFQIRGTGGTHPFWKRIKAKGTSLHFFGKDGKNLKQVLPYNCCLLREEILDTNQPRYLDFFVHEQRDSVDSVLFVVYILDQVNTRMLHPLWNILDDMASLRSLEAVRMTNFQPASNMLKAHGLGLLVLALGNQGPWN